MLLTLIETLTLIRLHCLHRESAKIGFTEAVSGIEAVARPGYEVHG